MPQNYNFGKHTPDWTDFLAYGSTAVALGTVIGLFFGLQVERVGILWGCAAGTLLFAIIGFWKQIRHLFRLFLSKIRNS